MSLFIGVMTGTSVDGVDIALVRMSAAGRPTLISATSTDFNPTLQLMINELVAQQSVSLLRIGDLHRALGEQYGQTINDFLKQQQLSAQDIRAIGCHGQTICHAPLAQRPFSLQLGDASTIAELTGITTITDFRQRDMVCGGQGAPLVPAFHQEVFHSTQENRVIVNIGGISNITLLPADNSAPVLGFDTGPGNILMDSWMQHHYDAPYDKDGATAAQGQPDDTLLHCLLEDPYFRLSIPKSTGREYFNLNWLNEKLLQLGKPVDPLTVQNTLLHLTCHTIADAIKIYADNADAVFICGGGVHNRYLMQRLRDILSPLPVKSSDELGISADFVEAGAFAWLAYRTLNGLTGNLPSVTGASGARILGGIYPA